MSPAEEVRRYPPILAMTQAANRRQNRVNKLVSSSSG